MTLHRAATRYLQAAGALLVALGFVHLAATSHIPQLLHDSPRAVYERLLGPSLVNHVLVGILLVPLGLTTWLAAAASERGEAWAIRVLIINTAAVMTLPISIAAFMRRPEYYRAPLFVTGVLLSVVISLLMALASVAVGRRPRRDD